MPVNWEAQCEMDRDVEEHADLYEVLADESDDEQLLFSCVDDLKLVIEKAPTDVVEFVFR